jgi:hypothetical protein
VIYVSWSINIMIWIWAISGWGVHRYLFSRYRPAQLEGRVVMYPVHQSSSDTVWEMNPRSYVDKTDMVPGDRVTVVLYADKRFRGKNPVHWVFMPRRGAHYIMDGERDLILLRSAAGLTKKAPIRGMRVKDDDFSPEGVEYIVRVGDGGDPW